MQTAKLLIRKRYYQYVLFLIPVFIVQVTVGTFYNKCSKIPQIHTLQTVAQQGGREGQYWASEPNHYTVKWLYLGNRSEYDTCSYKVFSLE